MRYKDEAFIDPKLKDLKDPGEKIEEKGAWDEEEDEEDEDEEEFTMDEIEEEEHKGSSLVGVPQSSLEVKSEDDILDEVADFIVDNPDYTDEDLEEFADLVDIDFDTLKRLLAPERLEKGDRPEDGVGRSEKERALRHELLHPGEPLPPRGEGRKALVYRSGPSAGRVFKWFKSSEDLDSFMESDVIDKSSPLDDSGVVYLLESVEVDEEDKETLDKLASVDSYDDWKTVMSTMTKGRNPVVSLLLSNTTTLSLDLEGALDLQKGDRLLRSVDEKFSVQQIQIKGESNEDLSTQLLSPGAIVSEGPSSASGARTLKAQYLVDTGRYEILGMNKAVMELDVTGTKVLRRGIYSLRTGDPSTVSFVAGII